MITVVGTGTGTPLAPDARTALDAAGLVVGGRRHLDAAGLPDGVTRVVLGPLAAALDAGRGAPGRAADRADAGVVVLASGDPGFFGIVRALAERFGETRWTYARGRPPSRSRSRGSGCRGTTRSSSARTDGSCGPP